MPSASLDLSEQKRDSSSLVNRDNIVLRESITNARVILFSCSAYRSMCDALYDQFQSGAGVILYRMGEGYAKKLLGAIPKLGLNRDEVIEGFEQLSFLAGWGKLNLRIKEDFSAECVVDKCAFVLRREGIGPTSCYFFSGVLGSVAKELFKQEYRAHEVKCESSGSPVCRFQVDPI